MSKEKYNQIIDDVYKNYAKSHTTFRGGFAFVTPMAHSKESFIKAIKTDYEFSEKWGLKIEERELSLEERVRIITNTSEYRNYTEEQWKVYINTTSAPTKLITLTYNKETIKVYE